MEKDSKKIVKKRKLDNKSPWNEACHFSLHPMLIKNIESAGFKLPSEVQKLTFKSYFSNPERDILISAETGSGKTLAFAIPIIHQILTGYEKNKPKGLKCIVMTPSRELAKQILTHIRAVVEKDVIHVECAIGGLSELKQLRVLDKSPEIVVGTPGRMLKLADPTEGGSAMFAKNLKSVEYLVLDEADKLVESKAHFNDVRNILSKLEDLRKSTRLQKFVVSATLMRKDLDPEDFFSNLDLHMPAVINVRSEESESKNEAELPEKLKMQVIRTLGPRAEYETCRYVKDLLEKNKERCRIMIFVNSISSVMRLSTIIEMFLNNNENDYKKCIPDEEQDQEKEEKEFVSQMRTNYRNSSESTPHISLDQSAGARILQQRMKRKGDILPPAEIQEAEAPEKGVLRLPQKGKLRFPVLGLHAKLQQKQRLKRIDQFSNSTRAVLLCTDVASRGLDIVNLDCVIHLHEPNDFRLFVHRSGRTARMHNKGTCMCVVKANYVKKWAEILGSVGLDLQTLPNLASKLDRKEKKNKNELFKKYIQCLELELKYRKYKLGTKDGNERKDLYDGLEL